MSYSELSYNLLTSLKLSYRCKLHRHPVMNLHISGQRLDEILHALIVVIGQLIQ